MKPPPAPATVFCPECGAQNLAGHERCWLCYHLLPAAQGGPLIIPAVVVDPRKQQGRSQVLAAVAAVTGLLVIIVGVGAFASSSTLGLIYCVLVAPAVVAAGATFAASSLRGSHQPTYRPAPESPAQGGYQTVYEPAYEAASAQPLATGLKTFFLSLAATVGIAIVALAVLVLLVVAAAIALIAQCFAALGGHP